MNKNVPSTIQKNKSKKKWKKKNQMGRINFKWIGRMPLDVSGFFWKKEKKEDDSKIHDPCRVWVHGREI